MKKLYTLFACSAFALTSMAQVPTSFPHEAKTPHYSTKKLYGSKKEYKTKPSNSVMSTSVPIEVDYNELEITLSNHAQFIWPLNSNDNTQTLRHTILGLDTLWDLGTFIQYPRADVLSYTIDSLRMRVGHVNHSTNTNNLIFSLIDFGSNNYPDVGTDDVLFSDTLTTDTSLVGPTWLWSSIATFYPDTSVSGDTRVGLVFEFDGSNTDTASVVFGFPHDGTVCPDNGADRAILSSIWPTSYYYHNSQNDQFPTIGGNYLQWLCDGNNNMEDILQHKRGNWYLTLEVCELSTSTTVVDDPGGCTGEGTVNATGPSPITYQWDANAGSQTTATATGLCPGSYSVTITDGDGCTSVENITVVPVGISESKLSSNINIFPNPSNGNFTINLNGVDAGEYTLELTNVLGEAVLMESIQINGNYTKNLNLSGLAKGVYSLTVFNEADKTTQKLIIE